MQELRLRRKLLFWIFVPFAVLMIALQFSMAMITQQRFYEKDSRIQRESLLRWIEPLIRERWNGEDSSPIREFVETVGRRAPFRLTVIDRDGRVIADNEASADRTENHRARREVEQALAGQIGTDSRFSVTRRKPMHYTAIPIRDQDRILGVVRLAVPKRGGDEVLSVLRHQTLLAGVVTLLFALLLSALLSRWTSAPLEKMRAATRQIAQGDLSVRIPSPPGREMGDLARDINHMVERLREEIRTGKALLQLQNTTLDGMSEGVIRMDAQGRVLDLNRAAAVMLRVDAAAARGGLILEILRDIRFQNAFEEMKTEGCSAEKIVEISPQCILRLRVESVKNENSEPDVLFLIEDITRASRLERVRKDFVSNVSHELRTPLSVIRAQAETLQDSRLDPQQARRFLENLIRQADRLDATLEDLLELARLEHLDESRGLRLEIAPIMESVRSAIALCAAKAHDREIPIQVSGEEGLLARLAPVLFERAIANLIENAIQYSEPGKPVEIALNAQGDQAKIRVRDHGCGIPAQHLDRIFERFYRVDKARSRKAGGTGLGLSIVRHIALAHRGRIEVESRVGAGSVFTLSLPLVNAPDR
ncbi:MAG: ATP-binding protein [Kiritimatiellia bacterium]|nr:ATP-binding protein [Kiritimatiellia bacterium]